MLGAGAVLAKAGYLESVRAAERILEPAHISAATARHANSVLAAGVGCSQPEISGDLTSKPPDVNDARARLNSLDQALAAPPPPAPGAESRLRELAGRAPYQREQPESPGELFGGWVQGREAALQAAACTGLLGLILSILEYLAIGVAALGAAIVGYRFLRNRSREETAVADVPELRRPRSADERFAAADRMAAAGDYSGAVRELAGAVATVLGGESAWEASPLTVRELFVRAGRLAELRPLLRGFEDSVYGHRPVDRQHYEAAAAAAAPHRAGKRRAA